MPREEWLAKLRAALDARDDLFVVARTDACAAVDLDEACARARARAAAELGVDVVLVKGPESIDLGHAVHPPWRRAGRHRLGADADRAAARGVGTLGADLKPGGLDDIGTDIGLDELDGVLSKILQGDVVGRYVVNVGG